MDGGSTQSIITFKFERHIATKIAARIGSFGNRLFMLSVFYTILSDFIGLFVIMGAQMESKQLK
jgi:hypothetical protein